MVCNVLLEFFEGLLFWIRDVKYVGHYLLDLYFLVDLFLYLYVVVLYILDYLVSFEPRKHTTKSTQHLYCYIIKAIESHLIHHHCHFEPTSSSLSSSVSLFRESR